MADKQRLVLLPSFHHAPPPPGGYKTRVSYSAAFKRDIFSLGVVAYTMLCGRLPYRSEVVPDLQVPSIWGWGAKAGDATATAGNL